MHPHILFHLACILGPYLAVWAVSLSTTDLITHGLTAGLSIRHSQFDHTQYTGMAPSYVQCSTSASHRPTLALKLFRGEPAISRFDWNFSPSHNSPLATTHPPTFQRWSVRSSIQFHLNFNLVMARSPGFGSTISYLRPFKTRFRCGSVSPT